MAVQVKKEDLMRGKNVVKKVDTSSLKAVPHIENVKGCYHHGGIWNKEHSVCIEDMSANSGCTAPVKGIKYCWMKKGNFIHVDDILADTNDRVYRETYDDFNPSEIADIFDDVILKAGALIGVYKTNKYIVCCNPFGKIVDCNKKDAVITHRGENVAEIADSYRRKYGHLKLESFYKDWKETMPRVYKKGPKIHDTQQIKLLGEKI